MQNGALRRRVQVGLNKGEAKNALARAVFLNRLGELRDRSYENQRYRASGLNLVVNAIILWNTLSIWNGLFRRWLTPGKPSMKHCCRTFAAGLGAHQPDRRLHLATG
jgi:hypothetical protein